MNEFMAKGGLWVVAQGALFAVIAGVIWWDGSSGATPVLVAIGIAVTLLGSSLALDGVLRIRNHITAMPAPVDGAPLVVSGSYGIVRHPIYGGLVVAAAGLSMARASVLGGLAAAGLCWFFLLKSAREEELLASVYPAYDDYRARVGKRLIPWLV